MSLQAVQIQKLQLAGSGCTSTATSIILQSLALVDGTLVTMTDFGVKGFATLEPGTSKEESISFTGVTQNADGTATLTGVTRGLRFVSPYDSVTANKQAHAGGAVVVVSNTSAFYGNIKDYADGLANTGAADASLTVQGLLELGTQAEIDAGTATGGSSAPLAVTPDQLALSIYATRLPTANEKAALAGSGTPSGANKFVTADTLAAAAIAPVVRTYNLADSPATWTKPAGLKYIDVELWGGGGSGGASTGSNPGGGGGGAYNKKRIMASALGATETVTVAAGGEAVTGSTAGKVGGNSSFGSHITVYGGGGGSAGNSAGGGGGGIRSAGSAGSVAGGDGGAPTAGAGGSTSSGGDSNYGGGGGEGNGSRGGESVYGGGGGGGLYVGGISYYGGGGGGSGGQNGNQDGGVSIYGGSGGATGLVGTVPAGGGGGKFQGTSGAGAAGRVIVTEHYI